MKWRCTWCGKPHAENDPPCEACGHNKFEEAVVRADEAADDRTVDTGETYVWACENCGREHVRNNPPCSRCGSPELEKTEQNYDDVDADLETPSWFAVSKPYIPVFAVIGVVVLLFATGIVSPSILPGIGAPSPPDAPGEGSEAAGVDLEETELAVHERLEAEREGSETSYDGDLAAFAAYQNRAYVAQEYDGAEPGGATPDDFGVDCATDGTGGVFSLSGPSIEEYDDEDALADAAASTILNSTVGDDVRAGSPSEGIDVHVVDGSVYVYYATC